MLCSYFYFGLLLEQVYMLMHKIFFSILSSSAALSETLWFSSCLFKTLVKNTHSPLIGQLTHTLPSTDNSTREAVLN